jgi:hypothetical protein
MILLFVASLLHQFKRRRARILQWLVAGSALCLIAANNLGSPQPEPVSAWNTVIVLFPAMLVVGSAFFFILLDRLNLQIPLLVSLIVIATLLLTGLPLTQTLTTVPNKYYNFPPYAPPYIKLIGDFAQSDEAVTTDMPWATAWYADHTSIWLPDSLTDFENLHDNVCPTGVLLLTPVTLSQPVSALTAGEYKDWLPFVTGYNVPPHFPLSVHTITDPGGPDYSIWCDRARWQQTR